MLGWYTREHAIFNVMVGHFTSEWTGARFSSSNLKIAEIC